MRVGKNFTAGLIGVALALIAWAPASAADPPLGGARISAVEGEALVQLGDGENWRAAPLNMPLLPGDRLQTGANGRLEVLLSDGTAVRLAPDSAARLVAVPPPDVAGEPAAAEVELEAGRANVATGDADRSRPALILDSAGARVYVYPRSQVRAQTVAADATLVVLREGAASVESQGTGIPLQVGETLQVGAGGAFRVAGLPRDGFDRWSEAHDRALAAAPATSPYVPAPLAPYTAELNQYGQWTSVPEYGPVWRPTVVVAGWSPFTTGEWVWRGTWVWVPVEPWGYVPFHYGRWRWDPFLGWYWVPPRPRLVVWEPGPVAWIVTPTYVSWIPLAPGEVYASPWPHRIWGGAASTTIINNVTNVTVIQKTFVNAAAPVQVVAVPATTFRNRTVVTPAVHATTRVSLASLVANQPAKVVTPAALTPAVAERRPSGRATPPVAGPNAAPQGRAPVPGATAPAPQAPGKAQGFAAPQGTSKEAPQGAQPPAQSPNAGRPGAWGREAGRTPETPPTQQREPERLRAERPSNGFTPPPATREPERPRAERPTTPFIAPPAAPRAMPVPAQPAPAERARPRQEPVRPEPRMETAPAQQPREPERPRGERPSNAFTAPPAAREPERPRAERPTTPFAPPPAASRAVPKPAQPAPAERARPREEPFRPQARNQEGPRVERQQFRPAPQVTPHPPEPARPAAPTPVPQAPSQSQWRPPARHEGPPTVAPRQAQDRGRHVVQAPPAPQPAKPSKAHPAPPEQPPHPAQVR